MLACSIIRQRWPRAHLVMLAAFTVLAAVVVAPAAAHAAYRQSYVYKDHIDTSVLGDPAFQPCGMAVDAAGDIFVAGGSDYVAEFAHNTTATAAATIGADLPSVFGGQVVDVALHGSDLWLCGADGAAKFSTGGTYSGTSITSVAGSPFDNATAIACDAAGNVFIADSDPVNSGYERIAKFTASGSLVCTFTNTNDPFDGVWSCSGLAVDSHGEVWVADKEQNELIGCTARNVAGTKYQEYEYLDGYDWGYNAPLDVAFGSDGSRYVAALVDDGGQVFKLGSSGVLAVMGTANETSTPIPGDLGYNLSGLAVSGNNVWVADQDAGRVSEFTLRDMPPTTQAYANLSVKKGKSVTFKFKASDDVSNTLPVTIKVFKGTTLKATISCGTVSQGAWHTKAWTCKLAKGAYTWKVYATDGAGHPVTPGTEGHKTLTVK